MKPTTNALTTLLKLAKVSSDDTFKGMLEEGKHEPAVQAPTAFRAMMRALNPFRFGLSWGYIHRGGKTGAFWFLNDFGARGAPGAVSDRITGALEGEGISKVANAEDGRAEVEMASHAGSLRQSCKIQRVAKFTGTREPRAGGYLTYEIELQEENPPLTVQQSIAAWPLLECPDLPLPFKEYLFPLVASEVSQGGTWTQYYDWTATIVPGARGEALELRDMKSLVEKHGWVLDREDRGTITYFKGKNSPPVVYLSIEAGEGAQGVQFRVQPRM
jgi:hypothetical protein